MTLGSHSTVYSELEYLPKAEQAKRQLVSNARKQRDWESFAVSNTAVKVNIPTELSDELLKYHWCWIQTRRTSGLEHVEAYAHGRTETRLPMPLGR
jgi:hypothetical protein